MSTLNKNVTWRGNSQASLLHNAIACIKYWKRSACSTTDLSWHQRTDMTQYFTLTDFNWQKPPLQYQLQLPRTTPHYHWWGSRVRSREDSELLSTRKEVWILRQVERIFQLEAILGNGRQCRQCKMTSQRILPEISRSAPSYCCFSLPCYELPANKWELWAGPIWKSVFWENGHSVTFCAYAFRIKGL